MRHRLSSTHLRTKLDQKVVVCLPLYVLHLTFAYCLFPNSGYLVKSKVPACTGMVKRAPQNLMCRSQTDLLMCRLLQGSHRSIL